MWRALLALLVGSALGCTQITVRPADGYGLLDSFTASTGTAQTLSPRTLQTFRQLDLEEVYALKPQDCFRRLQEEALRDPRPDYLFALAELAFQQAEHAPAGDACGYYYLCAGYAHHYLFDGAADVTTAAPFDPRFRLACDLYNAALARCLRTAQQAGRLDPREKLHLPTPDGLGFTLTVQHHGFAWGPDDFGPLLLCADYAVVGLANQHRRYGLGVPLIGTRTAGKPTARHAFYPDAVSFPVSAFFRFEGGLAALHSRRAGVLELHNPLAVDHITVGARTVPLEIDLTTPLAYFLAHTNLQKAELGGFLKPDQLGDYTGIYMLEPYQPGKIPVLMVHGLLSSPMTWATMFNDLRADPELRSRYQFWFYLYPTGPGYLAAAAELRGDLADLRAQVDPLRKDAALDQMVLVGHSMGGLVARLLTVDSGGDFWSLVSKKPLEQLAVPTADRAVLKEQFYFERQPGVKRLVFIGTPHRGSALGASKPGQLAAQLVELPNALMDTTKVLMATNPADWGTLTPGRLPTSVDLLSAGSPALELLVARPRPPDVPFHSIIGRALPRTLLRELTRPILGNEMTDGVVPYASSHLDEAESEITLPADHVSIHHHPLAVREVQRILREHLRTVDGEPVSSR